jgi:hypothetical protein
MDAVRKEEDMETTTQGLGKEKSVTPQAVHQSLSGKLGQNPLARWQFSAEDEIRMVLESFPQGDDCFLISIRL